MKKKIPIIILIFLILVLLLIIISTNSYIINIQGKAKSLKQNMSTLREENINKNKDLIHYIEEKKNLDKIYNNINNYIKENNRKIQNE